MIEPTITNNSCKNKQSKLTEEEKEGLRSDIPFIKDKLLETFTNYCHVIVPEHVNDIDNFDIGMDFLLKEMTKEMKRKGVYK